MRGGSIAKKLPPIEQFNIYSNHAFINSKDKSNVQQQLFKANRSHPTKESTVATSVSEISIAAPKKERDALVA